MSYLNGGKHEGKNIGQKKGSGSEMNALNTNKQLEIISHWFKEENIDKMNETNSEEDWAKKILERKGVGTV